MMADYDITESEADRINSEDLRLDCHSDSASYSSDTDSDNEMDQLPGMWTI